MSKSEQVSDYEGVLNSFYLQNVVDESVTSALSMARHKKNLGHDESEVK